MNNVYNKEQIKGLINKGMTARKIAKIIGVKFHALRSFIFRNGLKTRPKKKVTATKESAKVERFNQAMRLLNRGIMMYESRIIIRHKDAKALIDRAVAVIKALDPTKEHEYQVTVEIFKNQRSLEQNAYYWGVIVSYMSINLGYTTLESHEILKAHLLPKTVKEFKGEEITISGSTRKLSTKLFSDYIDNCIVLLAEQDVIVPNPTYRQ